MTTAANSDDGPQRRSSYGETTNHSLIELVKQGEPDAWKTFMGIYQPLVAFWCRSTSLSPNDLDDVSQNVFTSVSTSIGSFRKRELTDTFRGWLRDITQKRIADFFRKKSQEIPPLASDDSEGYLAQLREPEPPPESDPESKKASLEVFRNAVEAVRNKSEERTWLAFWRTTVDEQPAPDIAEELGMTGDAVRKAKSRMKTRLRLELGSLFDEIVRDAGVSLD
ncbi:MAG: sigma-70 family RNA polymerase sigma factor [Rhodopirellula sp.]|nr:sigma-70 family RNA polymerase sigma factor [Rhodopirellula sp.]